jgi:hypothetical protein
VPVATMGIDIGKNSFHVVGLDQRGAIVLRQNVFRRVRLVIVSPDSSGTACPLSGRNSTYRPVQISGATSTAIAMCEA